MSGGAPARHGKRPVPEIPGEGERDPARSRVAVTGLGIVCSLGKSVPEVWQALLEGRRGFTKTRLFGTASLSSVPVGEIEGFEAGRRDAGTSRLDRMTIAAAEEAIRHADLNKSPRLAEFGISLGNSNGGMLEGETWFEKELARRSAPAEGRGAPSSLTASPALRVPASTTTDLVAARLGLRGPRLTLITACSSSAAAIALAAERIRDGEVEGMIAGGGDPLCRLTYAGFASLRLLDPEGCRPFSGGRRGLTLGEGAGVLLLERRDRALDRGARLLAEVLPHGASCDAHHMTSCHPGGRGMEAAMAQSLALSGVRPDSIGYVNAHGTATLVNDSAEGGAIARLFGKGAAVSSTKSMYGHLLGGSGAVEAVTTILTLLEGRLPPTAGLEIPDGRLELDLVAGPPREARPRFAISNSFGFGGGNVTLLFAAEGGAP